MCYMSIMSPDLTMMNDIVSFNMQTQHGANSSHKSHLNNPMKWLASGENIFTNSGNNIIFVN